MVSQVKNTPIRVKLGFQCLGVKSGFLGEGHICLILSSLASGKFRCLMPPNTLWKHVTGG
jgi:hypothetical protein